jgi:hypothetical protein
MGITLDRVLHTERWAPLTELCVVLKTATSTRETFESFYNSVRRHMTANRERA